MKKLLIVIIAAALLSACNSNQNQLQKRAEELCKYIPDHELLEQIDDSHAIATVSVRQDCIRHIAISRREQAMHNGLNVSYYQDYGWPAVTLFK